MAPIILVLVTLTLTACTRDAAPAEQSAAATPTPASVLDSLRNVLFVGTSLTAGYGVGGNVAYPARIQEMIDAAALPYRVVNAGISGETSAGGLRRIDWTLQQPADVLVLELGANDGLRGIDPSEMRSNLVDIIQRARARNSDMAIVIVGMEAPPNLGDQYTSRFRSVFRELAEEFDAALVPFLLDSVAAQPELNIEDGMHPNVDGHQILARTVWRVLEPVLRTRLQRESGDDS